MEERIERTWREGLLARISHGASEPKLADKVSVKIQLFLEKGTVRRRAGVQEKCALIGMKRDEEVGPGWKLCT